MSSMDYQAAFNIAITMIGALGGALLKSVWDALRDLQRADTALTDRVHEIETLVAGEYATRADVKCGFESLGQKLDKIEAKLDGKQDRFNCPKDACR